MQGSIVVALSLATIAGAADPPRDLRTAQFAPVDPPFTAQTGRQPPGDPLPSWNDGPSKKAIVDFVAV